ELGNTLVSFEAGDQFEDDGLPRLVRRYGVVDLHVKIDTDQHLELVPREGADHEIGQVPDLCAGEAHDILAEVNAPSGSRFDEPGSNSYVRSPHRHGYAPRLSPSVGLSRFRRLRSVGGAGTAPLSPVEVPRVDLRSVW